MTTGMRFDLANPHAVADKRSRVQKMFAAIASIIAVAALALHALERLERRLFP